MPTPRPRTRAALVVALLLSAMISAASAQATSALDAVIARHNPAITALRHQIHRNPELAIAKATGPSSRRPSLPRTRGGTALPYRLIGVRARQPGPVVAVAPHGALRWEATGLPFASTVRTQYDGRDVGVMHACGHDIHTAVGLGTATVLAGMKADLAGTVVFIFQPAEEGAPDGEQGGAKLMLTEGAFNGPVPSAIFALHASPELHVGEFGITSGPAMAAADEWSSGSSAASHTAHNRTSRSIRW